MSILLCFPGAGECINARKVAFLRPDVYASVFPHRHLAASESPGPDSDQPMASQRVSACISRFLVHNLYLFSALLNEVSVGELEPRETGSLRASCVGPLRLFSCKRVAVFPCNLHTSFHTQKRHSCFYNIEDYELLLLCHWLKCPEVTQDRDSMWRRALLIPVWKAGE